MVTLPIKLCVMDAKLCVMDAKLCVIGAKLCVMAAKLCVMAAKWRFINAHQKRPVSGRRSFNQNSTEKVVCGLNFEENSLERPQKPLRACEARPPEIESIKIMDFVEKLLKELLSNHVRTR